MEKFYAYNFNGGCTGVATLEPVEGGWLLRKAYGSPTSAGPCDDGPASEWVYPTREEALASLRRGYFRTT